MNDNGAVPRRRVRKGIFRAAVNPAAGGYISAVHPEHQPAMATNFPGNSVHGR
jgi:hypothetical protein